MLILEVCPYRLQEDGTTPVRIQERLKDVMTLTIKKEQTTDKHQDQHYKLVGFTVHFGSLPQNGHAATFIQKEGRWTYYDDDQVNIVTATEAEEMAQSSAHILFYEPIQLKRNP